MSKINDFYKYDHSKTLFPLDMSSFLIENGDQEISDYVYNLLTDGKSPFAPQLRCNALKSNYHFRRTLKLDPICEWFYYGIVYKNRSIFRKSTNVKRLKFGYRFANGVPISASKSYRVFRKKVRRMMREYKFGVKMDISNYFNSVYHHDLCHWVANSGVDAKDVDNLSVFYREINGGRSIDFLPQGIYPSKMMGNEFIGFIEHSAELHCDVICRFMDDIYMFSNSQSILMEDFIRIQELLGDKNLSLNPLKTQWFNGETPDTQSEINEIKERLYNRRRYVIEASDGLEDFSVDDDDDIKLTDDEVDYLLSKLNSDSVDEEDVELALALLRDETDDVINVLPKILNLYPHLAKNIYHFLRFVPDKNLLVEIIRQHLKQALLTEFQLFWIAKFVGDYLQDNIDFPKLFFAITEHPSSTPLVRAKMYEVKSNVGGIIDIKRSLLKTGSSTWESWSAAVGCIDINKSEKNYMLKYFGRGSGINQTIALIMGKV